MKSQKIWGSPSGQSEQCCQFKIWAITFRTKWINLESKMYSLTSKTVETYSLTEVSFLGKMSSTQKTFVLGCQISNTGFWVYRVMYTTRPLLQGSLYSSGYGDFDRKWRRKKKHHFSLMTSSFSLFCGIGVGESILKDQRLKDFQELS